jgi:hypothetical protein
MEVLLAEQIPLLVPPFSPTQIHEKELPADGNVEFMLVPDEHCVSDP